MKKPYQYWEDAERRFMLWGDRHLADMTDQELYHALDHFRRNCQQYRTNVREAKSRFGDAFIPSGVFPGYYQRFMGAFREELRSRQRRAHGL